MVEAKQLKNNEFHVVDQKHEINRDLVGIIQFRQSKKWYISIAVVALFSVILALMIYFLK